MKTYDTRTEASRVVARALKGAEKRRGCLGEEEVVSVWAAHLERPFLYRLNLQGQFVR